MRRAVPLLLVLGIVGLGIATDPFGLGREDEVVLPEDPPVPEPSAPRGPGGIRLQGRPLIHLPSDAAPPHEFFVAMKQAKALLAEGKEEEALAVLAAWRTKLPKVFERPDNARLVATLESAVAKRREEAERAAARARAAHPPPGTTRWQHSRAIADLATTAEARTALQRHVDRFVPRTADEDATTDASESEEEGPDTIQQQFETLLQDRAEWRAAASVLAVADEEAQEERRIAQLRLLAERAATELLDPLHGALVWLALHQADDGHFDDAATVERCHALGHEKGAKPTGDCVRVFGRSGSHANALSATALALLAFLDFRDQDARHVFEPHVAKAVAWLLEHQQPDGSFRMAGKQQYQREFYTTAMVLMALGQAAASSGSEEVREAAEKGLAWLYPLRGPNGGYRYTRRQPGDVSVTGWVAQAVEAARWADAEIPDGMAYDLKMFLETSWLGYERFNYTIGQGPERKTLFPVGMLMGHILWEKIDRSVLDAWTTWLAKPPWDERGPPLYTLYYGVRVSLLHTEGLADPWAGWVKELAKNQLRTGGAAGMFPRKVDRWTSYGGASLVTALAALTLEHALYER